MWNNQTSYFRSAPITAWLASRQGISTVKFLSWGRATSSKLVFGGTSPHYPSCSKSSKGARSGASESVFSEILILIQFGSRVRDIHTLETMLAKRDASIASVFPSVRAAERELVLYGWNHTVSAFPVHLCVHEFCEEQVRRNPEAIALVFGERQRSYSELNSQANRLARPLRSQGVEPDSHVAICVEHDSR